MLHEGGSERLLWKVVRLLKCISTSCFKNIISARWQNYKIMSSSSFRIYLDNSMNQILGAGFSVTNDLTQIDTYTWDEDQSEIFADGFESAGTGAWSMAVP